MVESELRCPHCGRLGTLVKAGHQTRSGIGQIQQWRCKGDKCGMTTTQPIPVRRDDKGRFVPKPDTSTTAPLIDALANQL